MPALNHAPCRCCKVCPGDAAILNGTYPNTVKFSGPGYGAEHIDVSCFCVSWNQEDAVLTWNVNEVEPGMGNQTYGSTGEFLNLLFCENNGDGTQKWTLWISSDATANCSAYGYAAFVKDDGTFGPLGTYTFVGDHGGTGDIAATCGGGTITVTETTP